MTPMRIFGWIADMGGCGYYRLIQPLAELAKLGHTTLAANQMPAIWRDSADIVIAQRTCNPAPSRVWETLAQVRDKTGSPRLVYEVDDDLFNVDPSSTTAYPFFSRPDIQRRMSRNMAIADLVTVTTPELAGVVSKHNPNVAILPNYIDQRLLAIPRPELPDKVVIGWAGSPTHQMDFAVAAPQLRRLQARHPELVIHLAGAQYLDGLGKNARVRASTWVPFEQAHQTMAMCHIGIAPLRPHPFNRSKSWLKPMEYAALGIPCVASDEPPYTRFMLHGEVGFLARRDHEWFGYLRQLVTDRDLREAMGQKAREYAARFTIQEHATQWEQVYLDLLGRKKEDPDNGR